VQKKVKIKLKFLERKPHQLFFMQILYPGRIGIWRCWFFVVVVSFLWMRESRRPKRKTHGARREPTTNSTQV